MIGTPHVGVPDGDTGWCTCELPLRHPIHVEDTTSYPTLPAVDRNEAPVGLDHPTTAHVAAAEALPRTGTIKRRIFEVIAARPDGATDDELEVALSRTHQSVSAARNSLMNDGWITPMLSPLGGAVVRRTRTGHDATVWMPTAAARAQYAEDVA